MLGFSGLSIKTSSNQPSTVNSHFMETAILSYCHLPSIGVLLLLSHTFRGNSVFTPDIPRRHNHDIQKSSHFFAPWPWQIATPTARPSSHWTLQQLVQLIVSR